MASPEKSPSEPQPEEEEDLPESLRKQIIARLKTIYYGELTLIVERGRVKWIRKADSDPVTG
jgi:hypothetical protein